MNLVDAQKLKEMTLDDAVDDCIKDGKLQGKQQGVVYCKAKAVDCIYYYGLIKLEAMDYNERKTYKCGLCKNEYQRGKRNANHS